MLHWKLIIAGLLFISLLAGCYEPVEGCLDPRATNFDLDADEACPDDCCTYPDLKVRFQHRWSYPDTTVRLRLDTFYVDGAGHPFRIIQIRYYWSGVQLIRPDGTALNTIDSLTLSYAANNDTTQVRVWDNFLLTKAGTSSSTHTIGELEATGDISRVDATFGITGLANQALESSISPSSHPLAPQLGGMNLGSEIGYVFAKIELYQDTTATDTIPRILHLTGTDFVRPLTFDLPAPFMLFDGANTTVEFETDYAQWFDGVDVRQTDTTVLKQQIVENITQSFTLIQVLTD